MRLLGGEQGPGNSNLIQRSFPYQKLVAACKLKKVAPVACMQKLLVILNAMLKRDTPWQDQSQPAP